MGLAHQAPRIHQTTHINKRQYTCYTVGCTVLCYSLFPFRHFATTTLTGGNTMSMSFNAIRTAFFVALVSAILAGCGGGGSGGDNGPAPKGDLDFVLSASDPQTLVPNQKNALVGKLTITSKGSYSTSGFVIGRGDLFDKIQSVSIYSVAGVQYYVPDFGLYKTKDGDTAIGFYGSPWQLDGKHDFVLAVDLKPGIPLGSRLDFSLGQVVNSQAGVTTSSSGSSTLQMTSKTGYGAPVVTAVDSSWVSGLYLNQEVKRSLRVTCPAGNEVACSVNALNMTSSEGQSVQVSVQGISMPVAGYCSYNYYDNAGLSDWYASCNYTIGSSVGLRLAPGQSALFTFTSYARNATSWLSVGAITVQVNGVEVAPVLPKDCSLIVSDNSGCKG